MARTHKSQDPLDCTMSLGDHLEELRARVLLALLGLAVGVIVCTIFGKWIIAFIEFPYMQAMAKLGQDPHIQNIAPAEGLLSYMTISMVAGAVLSSPWMFYQIWKFVAAGLYPHERRYVYMVAPFSIVLFLAGAALFVFVLGPLTIKWLVRFNDEFLNTQSNFTFTGYVSFVANMTLVSGATFQTPIIVFFLFKIGVVTVPLLKRSRKYVLLAVVILVAMAAPVDVLSLLILCVPTYALYEVGILLCWLSARKKREMAAAKAVDTCDEKPD